LFYKGTEKSPGSGLGLYLVRKSIEKLNGNISVDSAEGRGTKFTISLPVN
jgi:signal transduction histidine kinase